MDVRSIKIITIGPGDAQVLDRASERPLLHVERSQGGPTPGAGRWFATPTPSSADMLAFQHDRAGWAIAWGPTRRECIARALAALP